MKTPETSWDTCWDCFELPQAKRFKQDPALALVGRVRAMDPSWELPKAKRFKQDESDSALTRREYKQYLKFCSEASKLKKEQRKKSYKEILIDYLREQPILDKIKKKMLDLANNLKEFNPVDNEETAIVFVIDE